VLAVLERGQSVTGAGPRRAGRLDHDVSLLARDQRLGVRADRRTVRGRAGTVEVEVGHPHELESLDVSYLSREHGCELARTDDADTKWLRATRELRQKIIHRVSLSAAFPVIYREPEFVSEGG